MRPLCEPCDAPMVEGGSYPAFEGEEEVHVVVWTCSECGARSEESAPPPERGAAHPERARRVA